jgi:hypothetical protein
MERGGGTTLATTLIARMKISINWNEGGPLVGGRHLHVCVRASYGWSGRPIHCNALTEIANGIHADTIYRKL